MIARFILSPEAEAAIKAQAELDIAANAERRKARALNNIPPLRQQQQEFLDSIAAKRSDSRFDGSPISGFGRFE